MLLEITSFLLFSSPDFYELWRSGMNICLVTEVKQQWATLVLDGRPLRYTTRVSDGFAAHASTLKPLSALLLTFHLLAAIFEKTELQFLFPWSLPEQIFTGFFFQTGNIF